MHQELLQHRNKTSKPPDILTTEIYNEVMVYFTQIKLQLVKPNDKKTNYFQLKKSRVFDRFR